MLAPFFGAPGMGADLEVRVLYRGGNPYCEPRARASP